MIVTGAGGFAIQLHDLLFRLGLTNDLVFYDDINHDNDEFLHRYKILHSLVEVQEYLGTKLDKRFVLGVGGPVLRKKFYERMIQCGGEAVTLISDNSIIGPYDIMLGNGVTIMPFSVIESCVSIGKGSLINLNALVTHNSTIGEFCEVSPGVRISGSCTIGDYVFIGTGAVLLPKIKIGANSVIGAGSVVVSDVPENTTVAGNPARVITK